MALKIKTKVLSGFLKKFKMDGTQGIKEAVLKFEKDGLHINANSDSKQARSMAWLKKEGFIEYEEIENVGVNDIPTVINVLERFSENITIVKEGNLLTVKGDSKKVDIELVSETFLGDDTGEPKLEFTETFDITATKLKDIYKDVQLNKDAIIKIETEEKKVKISNTGKYKFLNEFEALTCKGGVSCSFGEPLINATNSLDGVLSISMAPNFPIKIMEKTETSVITVIVAPRVDNNE